MKIDYREFISRHHKTAHTPPADLPKKKDYNSVWMAFVLVLFAGAFLFIAEIVHDTGTTRMVAETAFGFALLLGFLAYRSHKINVRRSADLDLIREVLEGSRGARLITDGADNTVYYNQKFGVLCQNAGTPGLEALTKLFDNNQETQAHFNLLAEQAHRGLMDSIELFSRFDDRERWLSVTAQPVAGYAGYVHWRIDDVTQQHTADRAIREEREKLIDFTDNAPVGFFSVDEKGRFVFANATFARWIGEDLKTLLEHGSLHTYLADPPAGARPYDLVEKNRPRQVVEVRMKGPGGKTFLASVNQVVVQEEGGQVRTRAVVHDLTSESEMRQALKASEDRFQRFFEEAPLGILQVNNQGVIVDCNNAFASMIDLPVGNLESREFRSFIQEEDREKAVFALERLAKGYEIGGPFEVVLSGNKGKKVVAQMYARKFRDSDNIVLHFIDVSERKTLEVQFVQSQKMQAIGQLAGGIAHDFNNLLTAIIGFCDLLLLRHKPGDPSFADLMQIKQNSNRAANLVRQLLAFSRQQTLRPKVQDITDILTELSHLLRRLIGANIDLELVHGHELGLVKVDEGQMEQVLINLAVNARDAMEGGGKLVISTENFSTKKAIELITEELPPGHWTLIKATDTGCGIPEENLARIFEPFFTTKEVGQGTGLGLATVYGIIRQTGGYLDVESRVNVGTTFLLYLPRATETDAQEEPQSRAAEEDANKDLTGTERILLVEDEDAVRMFSQRALSNKGYDVLSADSGESALAVMEKAENKHLDLLVTDVVMPHMDGPTLAKTIRKAIPELKIIFISGYTEDKLKDYMGENIWFLPKPFTLKQLAAKVKDVLGG
jgi:two-component system, cell cycle sensor histidine kinase and response regulator CckA